MNTNAAPLVRAFTVKSYETDTSMQVMETVYMVTADGAVFTAGTRKFDNRFKSPGMVWTQIDALPEEAGFIGNYHDPR